MHPIDWLPNITLVTPNRSGAALASKYLREACAIARLKSDDTTTKTAAVLVSATTGGIHAIANQYTSPTVDREKASTDRDYKLQHIEHAERGVLFHARRHRIDTTPVMWCPWYACTDCARAIVLSGITRVVGHVQPFIHTPERWRESVAMGIEILTSSGVVCEVIDLPLNETMLIGGQLITL